MPVQRAGRREMYNCGFCCAPARASIGRYTELHCRRCTAHRTPTSRFSTGPKSTAGRTAASASSLHTRMIAAAGVFRLSPNVSLHLAGLCSRSYCRIAQVDVTLRQADGGISMELRSALLPRIGTGVRLKLCSSTCALCML